MARWPVLVAALLLAGCSSPAEDPSPAEAAAAPAIGGPYTESQEFEGGLLGAGAWAGPAGGHFAGSFTPPHGFTVRSNATALRFDLAWDHVVPHDLYLFYSTPEGSGQAVEAGPAEVLAMALSTTIPLPTEGVWEVAVRATGVAAEVPYRLAVTIDYAA